MKGSKRYLIVWYVLLVATFGVIFADVAGYFRFADISFLVAFILYLSGLVVAKKASGWAFGIAVALLMATWGAYVVTGTDVVTERFAVWFYLFFLFGLFHYAKEIWMTKK